MWNDLNLVNPIHDICEYGNKDATLLDDLPNLVSILTASAESLTEDHPIWNEIEIFKNVQIKYKRILHCDKCLQLLQRVGGYLRKMVLLNLSKVYLNLGEKILMELQNTNRRSSYFLPSRQQLDFVLIRTQTAAKLICESLHYSREAFCYLIQRLKVGHLILNIMMATSVTARLNIVFKGLLIQIFHVYKNLYKWRERLKKGGWEWPKPLDLPEDLEAWINLQGSEHLKPKHLPKEELDFLTSIFAEDGDMNGPDPDEEDVVLLNGIESHESLELEGDEECIVVDDVERDFDDGVPITRSEMEQLSFVNPENEELNIVSSENEETHARFAENEEIHVSLEDEEPHSSNLNVSSSRKVKKDKKLTKAQKVLLKKIKEAEDLKGLKVIWNNLDVTSQNLLPKGLTPVKIRMIDKLFLELKRQLSQLSALPGKEREQEMKFLVKITGLKFAKHLRILQSKKKGNMKKAMDNFKLKPVKTCKELRILYEIIYEKLQNSQKYNKCSKLKKFFKSRKADIKLLVENDEKLSAKQLIYSTSKFVLSNYL